MTEATSKTSAKPLQSLLVPVDLTASTDRVLARLAQLPLAANARVTLLHVVPAGLSPDERRHAERDAHKALDEELRHLRKQLPAKTSVEVVVKTGAPAREISAYAARHHADLLVMGRTGASALRDSFLGSTAERVVRQTRLPVLVVRLPARAAYARPALALDLDQHAREVVRCMLSLLPPPRPRVDVIHAFDIPYHGLIYPSLPVYAAEAHLEEAEARTTRSLEKLLAAALAKAGVPAEEAPTWKTHVRYGSARAIVEKTVKRADSDLLVLGTHGYSGAAFVLLGTVAGELLRAARCDVLMVPPPGGRK